jgi:pyridinium-3,5-biscarboxylic acid mononucleotide synthase
MDLRQLKELLVNLQAGSVSVDDALKKLKTLPYEDLGFAKIDHHRHLRQGFPEVIFSQGKTSDQVVNIFKHLEANSDNILATRANLEQSEAVSSVFPDAQYNSLAKCITLIKRPLPKKKPSILIVSAGTADLPVAEEAAVTADIMGNQVEKLYDVGVAGLHRLLHNQYKFEDAAVIIVIAGMEGALASVVGGLTSKPIVAVPTSIGYGANFGGLSALLTMLNSCATGVGVVNIDNGFGAAALANAITSGYEVKE